MPYDHNYELEELRGIEEKRPWNLLDKIIRYAKQSDTLLDVGCGTAFKLIELSRKVKKIYGLEPNKRMLDAATKNIIRAGISNIIFIKGLAEEIPFQDNYFDIITCMVAPHKTSEIYRVLKPKGYAILEKIGDRDKWNFKQEFKTDNQGMRGQFSTLAEGELLLNYQREFNELFSEVSIQGGFWRTYYSLEGLILLLEQTPTIRNFDRIKDNEAILRIEEKYRVPKGIKTYQNRMLIVARK
ncbi:methyltransferase domain-containing protein [Candidatus Pacearchaeota archaeon]|nr:methyltransferase domain-containing protein [Candidatus Pacearchaeota archaeon]